MVRLADPGSHPGSQAALVDDVHGLLAVVAPEGVTQMGLSVGTEVTIRETR